MQIVKICGWTEKGFLLEDGGLLPHFRTVIGKYYFLVLRYLPGFLVHIQIPSSIALDLLDHAK